MNPIPYVLPLFLGFSAQKQPLLFQKALSRYPNIIHLQTQASLSASALSSQFMYTVGTGGFLDESIKSQALDRLHGQGHRLGADWDTDLGFTCLNDSMFGRPGWGYTVSFGNRFLADASLSDDMLRLALNGNAPYAGTTLNLGPFHADFTAYQQFQFSFFKSWIKEKYTQQFGFGLGFVQGNLHRDARANQWRMTTDSLGSFVDFQVEQALFRTSDPNKNAYFFPNGIGAVTHFWYQQQWKKHDVYLAVNDLGFIQWNDVSQQARVDTTWRWSGFYFPNITQVSSTYFSDYADSLRTGYLREEQASYTTLLPVQFFASYRYQWVPEKWGVRAHVAWRPFRQHLPAAWVSLMYAPKKWLEGQFLMGYGGYGSFFTGLDLGFSPGKGWTLALQTRHLDGLIPTTFSSGISAGFRVSKHFF
jgi:hypothetical protein